MKDKNILFFAQQIYYPWIEWVKNNSINICKWLNKKIKVNIISHKWKNNKKDFDTIFWVDVFYLLHLNDNKIIQFFYFFYDAFKSLYFIFKTKPKKIFVQYLDTSYILSLILIKIFNRKIDIYLTIYSTDELSIWYKIKFLKYYKFNKIIIISEYLRDKILKLWYKNKNIIYIPLSYDKTRYLNFANFEKRDKKTILFTAWSIKEAWSFLMVDLAKNMSDFNFIFAMRKFNKKSEDEVLKLREYIKIKWVKNIEIKRNIERMEDLLWNVGALVLPLQDINIKMLVPVALLEAMARWTICFVSDLENLKILVTNNINAVIFNKNNIIDLKEKIIKNIDNNDLALNAYKFAWKYPSFDEIIRKYYNLI